MNSLFHPGMLAAAAIFTGSIASGSSPGEAANGKSPAGNVVHLKRFEETPEQPWRHQLFQNSVDLEAGQNYTVAFWARASRPLMLGVSTKLSKPPWSFFGLRDDAELTTEWRRYSFNFKADGAEPAASRLTLSFKGPEAAEIWIAEVSIRETGPESEASGNLLKNPQFTDGLNDWHVEGKQAGVYIADVQSLADANTSAKEVIK